MIERCYNCGSDKHLALQCPYIKTGPAPKEEEMAIHTGGVRTDVELPPHIIGPAPKEEEMDENHPVIRKLMDVAEKAVTDAARTTERRALAREAYMAALGGFCSNVKYLSPIDMHRDSAQLALETVRRWDAFMAAVDAEGGE